MPRFFFQFLDGAHLLADDHEGVELPSIEDAREHALWTARELVADAVKAGNDLRFNAVVVADEHGTEVTSVQAVEILPKRLR